MFLRNQGEIVTSFAVCSTDSLRKHPPNQEGNALLSLSLLPFYSTLPLSLSLLQPDAIPRPIALGKNVPDTRTQKVINHNKTIRSFFLLFMTRQGEEGWGSQCPAVGVKRRPGMDAGIDIHAAIISKSRRRQADGLVRHVRPLTKSGRYNHTCAGWPQSQWDINTAITLSNYTVQHTPHYDY